MNVSAGNLELQISSIVFMYRNKRNATLKISMFALLLPVMICLASGCSKAKNEVVDTQTSVQAPTVEEVETLNTQMDAAMSGG